MRVSGDEASQGDQVSVWNGNRPSMFAIARAQLATNIAAPDNLSALLSPCNISVQISVTSPVHSPFQGQQSSFQTNPLYFSCGRQVR